MGSTVKFKKAFILIFLTALLMRFAVLLTNVGMTGGSEELYRGSIAQELLRGLRYPLWDYQADSYSGGSLVIAVLAAPLFFFLGPSLFTLKLVPLAFSLVAILLLMILLRRHFGDQAALTAGLLFAFCPPAFAQISMNAMGYHSESLFWSMLVLLFFFRFFCEERTAKRDLFLFGLFSGLGFWFTHIVIITVATCLLVWMVCGWRSFKSKFIFFLGSSALGLLPWAAYNLTHRFEGIRFIVKSLISPSQGGFHEALLMWPLRLKDLLGRAIPFSFGFGPVGPVSGLAIETGYFITIIFAVFLGLVACRDYLRDPRKKKAFCFFIFFPVVFTLVCSLSSIDANDSVATAAHYRLFENSRYFVPLHFFLFGLLGILLSLPKFRGWILFFIIAGLIGQAPLWGKEPFGRAFLYRGYSMEMLGAYESQIWPEIFPSYPHYLKSLHHYPAVDKVRLIRSTAHGLQFEKRLSEIVPEILEAAATESRMDLISGIGYGLGAQEGIHSEKITQVLSYFPSIKEQSRFYYGLVFGSMNHDMDRLYDSYEKYAAYAGALPFYGQKWFCLSLGHLAAYGPTLGARIEAALKQNGVGEKGTGWFYRGAGFRAGMNWVQEKLSFEETVRDLSLQIPPAQEINFYWGIGWGLRNEWGGDPLRARDWISRLPENIQPQAMKGLLAFERWNENV